MVAHSSEIELEKLPETFYFSEYAVPKVGSPTYRVGL